MELRTHARLIRHAQWFIILCTLAVGVAALFFAIFRPVSYKAIVSFDVAFSNRQETLDYQYGAYYDFKAAEIFTQHLMSFFMTPAIVKEVYQRAGVAYEVQSLSRFTNRFQTKQYSAQNFAVLFTDVSRENATRLSAAIQEIVVERAERSARLEDQPIFTVYSLEPVIAEQQYNLWLVTVVGLAAGFLLGLLLVYAREYFRS